MSNTCYGIICELEKVIKSFSKKQLDLVDKLIPQIGKDVAISLVSIRGKTSFAEIRVISRVIAQFEQLKVYSYRSSPAKVIIEGKGPGKSIIRFYPQYRINKPSFMKGAGQQYWEIDLLIEMLIPSSKGEVSCYQLVIEYDGYVSHYVESGVKSDYIRDLGVLYEKGAHTIRISPDGWKDYSNEYVDIISKQIKEQYQLFEFFTEEKLNNISLELFDEPELEIIENEDGRKIAVARERLVA